MTRKLSLLASLLGLCAAGFAQSIQDAMKETMNIQREQIDRMRSLLGPPPSEARQQKRAPPTITFSNPKAQDFAVDGTKIPDVTFDAGPSWSGLMPISGSANETRKLFFWFWPAASADHASDLVFWTNGGPGCSSLEGFLQENGPISWSWGQSEPTPNPFSWTNLGHMLYVEQPVGTGFSQGTPNITNDNELAAQVNGFLEQFLEVFSELKGINFWLTGESYAGFYVPYIANFIYENPGVDLKLQGIWIADPSLSYGVIQQEIPALRFAQANANVFPFNSTFMSHLKNISDSCGYTSYLDDFVTYPPKGQLPFPEGVVNGTLGQVSPACRIHGPIQQEVQTLNPVFNVYRVTDTFPNLWSVLGFPRDTQKFIYFNRTDVQDAIHAPHINWEDCADRNVYAGNGRDNSVASTLSVLPNVIDKSVRTVIVHGLADFILVAEGTRIAIQNMTFGGMQGFQTPIEPESFRVQDFGVFGAQHTERKLTYVEFFCECASKYYMDDSLLYRDNLVVSGHMTPQFVPWAAFDTMRFLLGQIPSPSTA